MIGRIRWEVDLECASTDRQVFPVVPWRDLCNLMIFLFCRMTNLTEVVDLKNYMPVPASPFMQLMLFLHLQTKWLSRHNISQPKKLSIWHLKWKSDKAWWGCQAERYCYSDKACGSTRGFQRDNVAAMLLISKEEIARTMMQYYLNKMDLD